ncbi:MAG: aspartyl protease family protein [Candidatus Eremiobacteraeota bacterium]|nr:aspartyl protease family protein [Candidatus Eremiobacteraeota bacterium]
MRVAFITLLAWAVFGVNGVRADTAYAPVNLTVSEVLAKARAARGMLAPGTYYRTIQTVGNGTTSQTQEYESGDDFSAREQSGNFTSAYGSNHGQDWFQDSNGTVTIESGFHDREDPYASALRPTTGGNDVITVLGKTTTDPACLVLQLRPHRELLQRRFYDAATFLLRRVETTDYDGQTTIYEYSDFRTVDGLTFPQTIAYHDGHSENDEQSQVLSFAAVPSASAHFEIPATRSVFDLQGRSSVRIPAEFTEHGIIVRVTIAGRGLDFELDSGASSMVVDAAVARQLGLTLYGVRKGTFGGDYTSGQTRVSDLALGDLHAHDVAIEAIPFNVMVGDRKIVGLLGGDFFSGARIAIDFKNKTVSMLAPSKDAPPAPWTAVPIEIDDLVPRVHAKFSDADGAFIVDLGADETMLFEHYFSRFHPDKIGEVQGQVTGVAENPVDYREYRFPRFDFGNLAFADAQAMVASGKRWESLNYDGLLGRNVLSDFNLIFDYPDRKLYIESMVKP